MRLVMMNADERFAQREGERLSGLEANHQRVRQTGTLGGGNGVEIGGLNVRRVESGLGDGHPVA